MTCLIHRHDTCLIHRHDMRMCTATHVYVYDNSCVSSTTTQGRHALMIELIIQIGGRRYTMRWLYLVGSIKLWVSFAKEPYKRDHILQKRPISLSMLLTVATPYDQLIEVRALWSTHVYLNLCVTQLNQKESSDSFKMNHVTHSKWIMCLIQRSDMCCVNQVGLLCTCSQHGANTLSPAHLFFNNETHA